MTFASTLTRYFSRSPLIAAVLYLAAVGTFVAAAGMSILDIIDHARAVQETAGTLEQLRSKEVRAAPGQNADAEADPFLEGSTLTVAGAALLQRVSGAIAGVGGSVQSSQVDIAAGGKDGIVSLLINCELDQATLQKLLFDLETGSPMLIVDQIDVQTPGTTSNDASVNQLRISLSVSGRWRGVK